jgi:hypothetical protein
MKLPALRPARRRARHGEQYILEYEFPYHVRRKLGRESPGVSWDPVERGLREWLICCAYRRRRPLAMPSRAVDFVWHAFILDTAAYRDFCDHAYGRFLDHFPEGSDGDAPSAYETVWAWDRSRSAEQAEATLWALDTQLDLEDPWGVSDGELAAARTTTPTSAGNDGVPFFYGDGGGCAGGDAGAGGCGGGGCGGGGCGGGGCGGGG